MPIERLTDARLRGLTHEDGEIIDAKSAASARAASDGAVTSRPATGSGKSVRASFSAPIP